MEQKQTSKRIRVVVADGQPKVRFALRVMLERRPDLRVVGEAEDRAELFALASQMNPDLVLLGWGSPGMDEDDLPGLVVDAAPNACLVVLSAKRDRRAAALAAGARSFVYKGDPPEELLGALDSCLERHGGQG